MSKISELSDGGSLQSTDYLIAVRSGGNVKVQPNGSLTLGTLTLDGLTVDTSTLHVDATNNRVGVGTTTPGGPLEVTVASGTFGASSGVRLISADGGAWAVYPTSAVANPVWNTNVNSGEQISWSVGGGEVARLDTSGNLLVGKTTTNYNNDGFQAFAGGFVHATGTQAVANSGTVATLNRKSTDGSIVDFRKDGTAVGSIGTETSNSDLYIGNGDTAIMFHDGNDAIFPHNASTNTGRDAAIDIGYSAARFKDLYLSGTAYAGSLDVSDYIYHSGDSNTYFGFPAGDQFSLVTGAADRLKVVGSETVFNEDGGDRDFRVESDTNTHMLFVDAGNNQVAVGTSGVNSGFMFGVQGSATIGDRDNNIASGGYALELSGASLNDTTADFGSYGALRFYATASYTGSARRALITNGYRTNQLGFLIGDVDSSSEPSVADRGNAANAIVPLSFEYNGVVVVNQEGGAGVDFRVESDSNTHQLAVDAGKNNVQINNSNVVTNTDNGSVIVTKGAVYYSQVLSMPSPYTGNVQIDLDYSSWGSNNTVAAVDVMILTRQFNTTSGIAMGKMFATNTSSGSTFTTFTTTDITTSNCTFTASSPSSYRLRLVINPSNITDLVSIVLTIPILGAGALSEITAQIV